MKITKVEAMVIASFIGIALYALFWVAVVIGVIWAAFHFISKLW